MVNIFQSLTTTVSCIANDETPILILFMCVNQFSLCLVFNIATILHIYKAAHSIFLFYLILGVEAEPDTSH